MVLLLWWVLGASVVGPWSLRGASVVLPWCVHGKNVHTTMKAKRCVHINKANSVLRRFNPGSGPITIAPFYGPQPQLRP